MTADEWKKAEQMLRPPYGHAKFLIDGYNVIVEMRLTSSTKFSFVVFVDGVFKGEWLTEDCDIRRRFCYKGRQTLLTSKKKDEFIKKFGKREYNRFIKENRMKMS